MGNRNGQGGDKKNNREEGRHLQEWDMHIEYVLADIVYDNRGGK